MLEFWITEQTMVPWQIFLEMGYDLSNGLCLLQRPISLGEIQLPFGIEWKLITWRDIPLGGKGRNCEKAFIAQAIKKETCLTTKNHLKIGQASIGKKLLKGYTRGNLELGHWKNKCQDGRYCCQIHSNWRRSIPRFSSEDIEKDFGPRRVNDKRPNMRIMMLQVWFTCLAETSCCVGDISFLLSSILSKGKGTLKFYWLIWERLMERISHYSQWRYIKFQFGQVWFGSWDFR